MMTIADFEQRFQSGLTAMAALSLPEARRSYDRLCAGFAPDLPKGMELGDTRIADVAVRWHRPARSAPGRVVYVHGGSFSLGSLDSHQGIAAGLAEALGHEVLSIDYRLLPEVGYAAALDDCRRVIAAVAPLALVGDSAGARLLLDVIDDPEHAPVLGLIYPLVGQPTGETLGPDAPLLSRDDVLEAWAAIAPDAPTRDALSPPASRIEVLAVSRDPLTVPLERAVSAWRSGGAEVGYHIADDMLHGCLHARESLPEMASAWMTFCQALKRRLDG